MKILVPLIATYLFCIAPKISRKDKQKPFEKVYLAHRGLFNNTDIPENSLPAFKKAVENGYGMELDVQLSTDNQLVVFHDASLKRMTGIDKNLTDCSYDELLQYNLLDTNIKIPLFKDVVDILNKDTPLIIEIKSEGPLIETTKRVVEMMKQYDRTYSIESFNPKVVKYLKDNHPEIIRGQLAFNYFKYKNGLNLFQQFVLTYLLENFVTRPDYIAYDINNMKNISFKIISRIFKGECVAWTVKSENDLKMANEFYDCIIFDSFIPKEKRSV